MTSSTLASLARVSDRWLNRSFAPRLKAMEALAVSTGFSAPMIAQAIDAAFEELTASHLHLYVQEESLPLDALKGKTIVHILPSNVFTAWVPGVYISLLLGADLWLKPSTREPVFAPLWLNSLKEIDPALAARIRIAPWDPALLATAHHVIAYGSDETLRQIENHLPPSVSLIGFGSKMSVAVVFREAFQGRERATLLDRLLADIVPFRLQGCLSPQTLYVEGKGFEEQHVLQSRVDRMPQIRPFDSWEEVENDLRTNQGHLSCLGYAGSPERLKAYIPALERLGFSRICPLGEMQKPPLSWRNGGISLVEKLALRASL